jgi:hypothetical protein
MVKGCFNVLSGILSAGRYLPGMFIIYLSPFVFGGVGVDGK